ncbi:4'-phosphopantetheinyl transferase superfamily protein [Streptomyces sp. NPDC006326]|uniref:4'-phosphopantetheinyl transferase family protein n=1 Tax=Streptomyces sp. NPDC006326 TaxID=3156752 RepID=UPI00339E1774
MNGGPSAGPGAPVHVPGPEGPWEEVGDRLDEHGRVVVFTTWGQWMAAALLDPGLRPLLGQDWPRYRQTPAAAGRLRFAVSRAVMKYAAATALDVPPASLDLGHHPGGRPVLRGLGGEVELSLAHTDELIVVGVSRTGPIGVDAEPADRALSFDLLRDHVCTAREGRALAALPEEERRAGLLRLWTLKEAYTKALGHGLRRRFPGFGFGRDAEGRTVLTEGQDDGTGAGAGAGEGAGAGPGEGAWEFATHLVQDRYVVSSAHRRRPPGTPAREPAVDTASGRGAGPLEETAAGHGGELRFLRPVTSGPGRGRRTP